MALVIIKESTTIKDEQTQKEALQFTIGRHVGQHTDCAVRVVIPVDANDPLWLTDVHISLPLLDQLQNDIQTNSDLNCFDWFRRSRQQQLLKLLWHIYDDIITVEYSPDDGFDHIIENYPDSSKPAAEPLHPTEREAARRMAAALLRVRDPEFLKQDIEELRKKLFKEKKHWLVVS